VKFDIVVRRVIALTPSCRACSGARECGFVTLLLAGLAPAPGMKRTHSESPVRPKCGRQAGSRPRRQTRQRASEAGEGEDAGPVPSPEMGMVADLGTDLRETGGKADVVK